MEIKIEAKDKDGNRAPLFSWEDGAWKCDLCGARVGQGKVDEHECGESENEAH